MENFHAMFKQRSHMKYLTLDVLISIIMVDIYPVEEYITQKMTKLLTKLLAAHYDNTSSESPEGPPETDIFS